MKRLIIIILVTFMQSGLVAQEFYGSGAFTEIGFSARSLALGNTMFSDSDPAVAIYFNPAIVTNRNRKSIHFNHRTNNDYFGTLSMLYFQQYPLEQYLCLIFQKMLLAHQYE